MKVKIVEEYTPHMLEKQINYILSKHHPSEIVDIKYTGSGSCTANSRDLYSAMIIFYEKE